MPMVATTLENTTSLRELAEQSHAWPFEEARKIVARLKGRPEDEVIFETGYGPSGLPHIGTFGEVARTTMVRHAFHTLTEDKVRTRLIAFSDDMDGLRKVPDNVPNKDMLATHLGKPLTRIPDPFSNAYSSFGAANNARLRAFLDRFGFDYEFASSTDYYASGRFDATLLKMLAAYDQVMAIILPTLGPERRATYSPFLPISQISGKVLQVPMIDRNAARGTVTLAVRGAEGQLRVDVHDASPAPPILDDDVPATSEITDTEIFGPVLSLVHADNMDEALAFLERSAYGNQASLFTSSGAAARRFRYEAPAGNIGINIGVAAPMAYFPFSGWKNSFFGDLHGQGRDAIEFYTDKKVVVERWAKEHSRKF